MLGVQESAYALLDDRRLTAGLELRVLCWRHDQDSGGCRERMSNFLPDMREGGCERTLTWRRARGWWSFVVVASTVVSNSDPVGFCSGSLGGLCRQRRRLARSEFGRSAWCVPWSSSGGTAGGNRKVCGLSGLVPEFAELCEMAQPGRSRGLRGLIFLSAEFGSSQPCLLWLRTRGVQESAYALLDDRRLTAGLELRRRETHEGLNSYSSSSPRFLRGASFRTDDDEATIGYAGGGYHRRRRRRALPTTQAEGFTDDAARLHRPRLPFSPPMMTLDYEDMAASRIRSRN
ncbi:hypothetical protein KSP39_PZI012528 [Platanthera zijinensis]|uniref:Uncharacterized protein n=1 Tax=Platanthera zijinensis TaxID=2320716 RepID=A0AAP0BFL1_9ASPA